MNGREEGGDRRSASDESRIKAARNGGITGALDNGTAVGKQRHLVRFVPELQDEFIMADGTVGLEAAIHFREVDRASALMDLHGIPAAKRDVRAPFTREVDEVALAASATVGPG